MLKCKKPVSAKSHPDSHPTKSIPSCICYIRYPDAAKMDAGPSYTVLRIKRKATEPPLSSLG
jgi:hypothetical protein